MLRGQAEVKETGGLVLVLAHISGEREMNLGDDSRRQVTVADNLASKSDEGRGRTPKMARENNAWLHCA